MKKELKRNGFDRFADFITSINSVVLALVFLLLFLMLETQTLFNRRLPQDMWYILRIVGSFSAAIVFEFTVLIFTANHDHSDDDGSNWFTNLFTIPKVLAYFHFLINCWFWEAWTFEIHESGIDTFYRFFLSGLFSYMAYIYSALFIKKYRERKQDIDDQVSVLDLQSQLDELRSQTDQLKSSNSQLKSTVTELRSSNDQLQSENGQIKLELDEAQAKLSRKKTGSSNGLSTLLKD